MDVAVSNTSGTQLIAGGTTIATTTGTASTSVLRFSAVEDIGGGMKVTAQYNFDPRATVNDNAAPVRDEMFVGVSGGFGNVKLGSMNSIGLGAHLASTPLGTGIGSGYGLNSNVNVITRHNRSVRYDTPNMSGFTASVLYAPGNDVLSAVASSAAIVNARQATEFGLSYAAGPLTVVFANVGYAAQVNALGVNTGAGPLLKVSNNILSANYKLGATTLYASVNNGDLLASSTILLSNKGSRVAIKQDMGAISLMASYSQQTNQQAYTVLAGDLVKTTVAALRADYNLSKTAVFYVGYEKFDTGRAYGIVTASTTVSGATLATSGDRSTFSIGLRKAF